MAVVQAAANPAESWVGCPLSLLPPTAEAIGFDRIGLIWGGGVPRALKARCFIMTFTMPALCFRRWRWLVGVEVLSSGTEAGKLSIFGKGGLVQHFVPSSKQQGTPRGVCLPTRRIKTVDNPWKKFLGL